MKNNERIPCRFWQKPLAFLIKRYDKKARESIEGHMDIYEDKWIKLTNSIKEVTRHVDLEAMLKDYVEEKFKHHAGFVNAEARNSFKSNKVTKLVIKCDYSYNYYGIRVTVVNRKLTGM